MLAKAIAVIDDEADLVNLFKEVLENDGFDVTTFTDPLEALEHVRENHKKYSLIISDFRMPKLDGYELCTEILTYNSEIKVILISAYDDVKCDKSRFTFLNKPVPITRLLKVVNEILDRQSQTQQQPSKIIPNLERKYHTLYNIDFVNTKLQYQ